ncbi:hypothetical protein AAGR22_11025 [Erwinia sp. HDF1-3R]|uniref:hypothetical protein n=1 Tax=Erwinia sp. HDF1-3R TaxID=3141543 RepID=UPI0031F4B22A
MNNNQVGLKSGHRLYNNDSNNINHKSNINNINNINNNLLKIESELNGTNEPDNKRKLELNDLIFGFINQIEGSLEADYGLTNRIKKDLQALKIKFGMAAMKCGDTNWESFNLSGEVHGNNELFINQNSFALSLDELQTQGITEEIRTFAWNCCRYNFAHTLIYTEMPAPADKVQEEFSTFFEQYKKQGISENITVAAANAKIAEKLCKKSFDTEDEALTSPLFIASRKLNKFYDDFIKCEKPETDANLRLEGEILSKHMSVFIPTEVKERLKIG